MAHGPKLLRRADRMVRNKLDNDPEELGRWATTSHVKRVPVTAKKTPPPTPASERRKLTPPHPPLCSRR